jgi:hypothetical protein
MFTAGAAGVAAGAAAVRVSPNGLLLQPATNSPVNRAKWAKQRVMGKSLVVIPLHNLPMRYGK